MNTHNMSVNNKHRVTVEGIIPSRACTITIRPFMWVQQFILLLLFNNLYSSFFEMQFSTKPFSVQSFRKKKKKRVLLLSMFMYDKPLGPECSEPSGKSGQSPALLIILYYNSIHGWHSVQLWWVECMQLCHCALLMRAWFIRCLLNGCNLLEVHWVWLYSKHLGLFFTVHVLLVAG